jgi:hypothetical protein
MTMLEVLVGKEGLQQTQHPVHITAHQGSG